jgi:beta-lactamase regulating signal transducer with metallopeptidase domain
VDAERILANAFAWLATYAVHGAVLCALAWAIGLGLARFVPERRRLAAARERLWKLAIFGGLATATLTTAGAGAWELRIGLAPELPPIEAAPQVSPLPAPELASAPETKEPALQSAPAIPAGWMDAAAWIWIGGIALGAAAWRRDRRRLARRLRGRVRAESGLAATILADLRRRSGTRADPVLWIAPGLASPISLGILRPAICIPPHAETSLLREELEGMLAHELAHVERRDALLLALCRAVEVVLFVQPFHRAARARLMAEIEIGCDERAAEWTGDPAALASCLAEVATWIVAARRDELVPAMAARGSRLEQRVRGLLDPARKPRASARASRFAPATWALGIVPLALGGIALDAERGEFRSPPPASAPAEAPAADPAQTALELNAFLALLEQEYTALAADPRLPSAPERIRERAAAIGTRIQSLRAASARLDALLAGDTSQER